MSIARNDPCPCGSGKKYKKCHGASDRAGTPPPDAARANALKACDVQLGERLMRFARMHYGRDWLRDILESAGLLDDDGELSDGEMSIVIPWLQYLSVNDDGRTLAQEWRAQDRNRLSPDERALLEAYDSAWVSIWEVAEVTPGVGSRVTDVLTREERFIHDVRSSSMLQRFDTILAIVLTCDGVSFFGGIHAQPLPPRFAEVAVREARRICRVRTRAVAPEKLRDPELQIELVALWNVVVDDMLHQPPPSLQNTDGDPFVVTRDDFALLASSDQVAHRLSSLAGAQEAEDEDGDTVFVVTKPGNPLHRSWDNTVIGRIVLSAARLTTETNSTRRADALKSAIETHLQGLVRFRLRKEENTADLLAAARANAATGDPRADEPPSPEAVAALRQFREQHLKDWIDDAIPALGGITPRMAARSQTARPKLETLLKELERSEARQAEAQRLDLRWLREELGLA